MAFAAFRRQGAGPDGQQQNNGISGIDGYGDEGILVESDPESQDRREAAGQSRLCTGACLRSSGEKDHAGLFSRTSGEKRNQKPGKAGAHDPQNGSVPDPLHGLCP